ncbi:MAG: GIY-YIG nuclease family protein [Candidatus Vogelbacteria bacterium]|nr:GIY-YIG nuclease family protein [Candidatus Vogelbacteria bacterium]
MDKLNTKLPDSPGVYFFKKGQEVLYIGKATSLRDRVRSYFNSRVIGDHSTSLRASRGERIVRMVELASKIAFRKTDSVLEALILEAELIRKYKPKYNSDEKDDKSFNYVVITDEDYPRILIGRGRILNQKDTVGYKIKYIFGPYPHGGELREALRIVRKIFPFRDGCLPATGRACFNAQINLCPGVCSGQITRAEYSRQIRNIKLFFEGKKTNILRALKKEMEEKAGKKNFERAAQIRNKIFALEHIQDVTLLKRRSEFGSISGGSNIDRIEAYDVAHLAGLSAVGVMVVIEKGEVKVSEYRKFEIRGGASHKSDVDSLREVLERRMNHPEWRLPDLMVVDGARAQVNVAEEVSKKNGLDVPVVGVVKDEHHKPRGYVGSAEIIKKYEALILLANSESHRFAIGFHKQLRNKTMSEVGPRT